MAKCFHLKVQTPEGIVFEGEAESCSLLTSGGSVGVLANHAPMLCALREGEMRFRTEDGTEKRFRLPAGVADVRDNSVTILADRAE